MSAYNHLHGDRRFAPRFISADRTEIAVRTYKPNGRSAILQGVIADSSALGISLIFPEMLDVDDLLLLCVPLGNGAKGVPALYRVVRFEKHGITKCKVGAEVIDFEPTAQVIATSLEVARVRRAMLA